MTAPADESPFRAARITEGYPFDETDQKAIKQILEDVRQRQHVLGGEKVRWRPFRRSASVAPPMSTPSPPDDVAYPHYFSTYCIHGHHTDCRLTCKFCDKPCRCDCHVSTSSLSERRVSDA